jgi:2,4-dienoyl-CoA reductase-like NADH-dependent reductase (Old Yellow Enzyme family)/thioredoxin reductase
LNAVPQFERLSQSFRIGSMTLVNRIVMPSMGNNYGTEDGYVTDRLIDYYVERANHGPGLIITEMASIDYPMGRRGSHELRIDNDTFIEGLTKLTRQIHNCGRKTALQLCHAGIQAGTRNIGLLPLEPSQIDDSKGKGARAVAETEIEYIITQFVSATLRAKAAGFDGVEIHAAHNYLLAHFCSPVWNKRQDKWGGNTENRARILVEVIKNIRMAVGSGYPVWCRINGAEIGLEGGLTIGEAKEIAHIAEQAGYDAIHVSASGYAQYYGYNRASSGNPKGNLIELAAEIKKAVNVPVIAVGRISLELGEQIVREGKADLIAIGRGQIADPNLVNKSFAGNFDDIRPCLSCNTCVDDLTNLDAVLHCSVNACVGKERASKIQPANKIKKILVVGGGPGGMEAAIVAALRGHKVTIWDKQAQLGGKLLIAAVPPRKEEIKPFTNYLINQIKKLGVKVELNKTANAESIKQFKPDAVIIATGANPLVPKITGICNSNVVIAEDVLAGKAAVGQRVVVVGGGLVGCETAEYLVEKGKKVTIVEMLNEIAVGVGTSPKVGLLYRLKTAGVTMLTGTKCQQINDKGVIVQKKEGKEQTIEVDTVVLAVGARADSELAKSIKDIVPEVHLVGDCVEARRILNAVGEGHSIGLSI